MCRLNKWWVSFFIMSLLSACAKPPNDIYERYQTDFTNLFDTHTRFVCYVKNKSDFDHAVEVVYKELFRLNCYFDIYHEYEGFNNIKSINDNAGIMPVPVSIEIIELLKLSQKAYELSDGTVNVALGPVLAIWHEYREAGLNNPALAVLPSEDTLQAAIAYTDITMMVIDESRQTVYLKDAGMRLDVGALAKGFAAQRAIDEAKRQGIMSCLINMGGNVVASGKPADPNRKSWNVGVQNPSPGAQGLLDTVYINDKSVVTSGDYQRFYMVDSVRYNHIIDPATLMPAQRYHAVTVVVDDSGMGDILSTALFILPYEKGRALAETCGASALWVMPDMTIITNDLYCDISKTYKKNELGS